MALSGSVSSLLPWLFPFLLAAAIPALPGRGKDGGEPPPRPSFYPPPELGCIGLLIRGLMGTKPPAVTLVTSRGCQKEIQFALVVKAPGQKAGEREF